MDPCRPDMGPPKHVNCFYSLNCYSEMLQYLTVPIENGLPGLRGREISSLSPPHWLRYWMAPLRLKIGPCRPVMDPPNYANCLFSLNFDSERMQYLIVRMANGPPGSKGEGNFIYFTPWLRHWRVSSANSRGPSACLRGPTFCLKDLLSA